MKIHHGINVSFDKAWRGCEIVLNSIRGTYTAEEVDDEGRFKFYFMALAASIDKWNYCVPVISVDGALKKNKYLGTLISACTIDDNSQIVPLAFAVVDSENDLSWAWFFKILKLFLENTMKWLFVILAGSKYRFTPEITSCSLRPTNPLLNNWFKVQTLNLNPSRANEKVGPLVQDLDSVLKGTTYLLSQKWVGANYVLHPMCLAIHSVLSLKLKAYWASDDELSLPMQI
ncbi:protein FAR1-RELATED SEQUENCE 2-like [Cucumis melo var. makuwa]|uniref:Protein FAR1-RELATED SEQUENCE 2-like n=1 Tax=Cucumis melo var. makuwa TaxID=1194695 RepID=A0A5A7SW15_CUCMM|nr:protein FAR1-RELATED SEQUENCE 2-like [Cucumis melo var. makuwa]TYK21834.1 protein FAR1-RELATED SEQUENCE 2-like [Cucumis melo var. makuwa]